MPLLGADPRKFLRNNLLMLASELDNPPPAAMSAQLTVLVKLVDRTADWPTVTRNRNRRGFASLVALTNRAHWEKPANLYEVSPAQQGDPGAFPAYVCRWAADHVCTKSLGHDADVMFTGTMNGCTFGIGMPANDGSILVGHANAAQQAQGTVNNPDFTQQRQAQVNALTAQGAGAHIVDPNVYRANVRYAGVGAKDFETVAVTIGIRINRQWEFYYQHQRFGGTRGNFSYEKMSTTKVG